MYVRLKTSYPLISLVSLSFSSTLLLLDNLAYTKYIFPERYSDKEYIKHLKSILTAGCIFWVKHWKNLVFSNGAPTHNYELGTFKCHKSGGRSNEEGRLSQFFKVFIYSNFITISFRFLELKMRKSSFFNSHIPLLLIEVKIGKTVMPFLTKYS